MSFIFYSLIRILFTLLHITFQMYSFYIFYLIFIYIFLFLLLSIYLFIYLFRYTTDDYLQATLVGAEPQTQFNVRTYIRYVMSTVLARILK